MEEFLKGFGNKIQEYRHNLGVSQEHLAELAGLAPNTVTNLENGKTFITYKSLCALCKALNVSPVELFNFNMSVEDENLTKILALASSLSIPQQKHLIEIIKSFKKGFKQYK